MTLPAHISDANGLTTTHEATRAGFIAIALEKNRRADPHVAKARALKARAKTLSGPTALVTEKDSRAAVLAASGLSVKALKFLTDEDRDFAIREFVEKCLLPSGEAWVEELTYRFLLTQGDALGGEMRNVVGRIGDERFLSFIIGAIQIQDVPLQWMHKTTKKWQLLDDVTEAIKCGSGLEWRFDDKPRTLLFNVNVPLVGKNVDSILLGCTAKQVRQKLDPYIKNPHFYIALGELKGGIDPAGADEHWKTANHTLSRIGREFAGAQLNPKRFFVGAAIESAMAIELVKQLQSSQLANAANLTNDIQMAAFTDWLVRL